MYSEFLRSCLAICAHDEGEDVIDQFIEHSARAFQDHETAETPWVMQIWLVQRADLDHSRGDTLRAAKLLGAGAAFVDRGESLQWSEEARRDRTAAAARAALGDDAYNEAFEEGRREGLNNLAEYISGT